MLLTEDPRWIDFVARYSGDLPRFAIEVCGELPTWQQFELYTSVGPQGSKTTAASGRGTGKSRSIGVVSTWHLLCHYSVENRGSIVVITATQIEQVRSISWKEIVALQDRIRRGPFAWIADYYTVETERVYVNGFKETWWIIAKTAPSGKPENMSGFHSEWMLLIADEASGIPDANLKSLVDTMTDERNRMLMTSQPTRPVGYFYESHHKLSKREGGHWTALVFNSEESPLVSKSKIAEYELEYGGRDSEQYQITVLGLFPDASSKFLIGRRALDKCFESPIVIPDGMPFGWMVSVDVAAGEYRDKSVVTVSKVAGFTDFGADARRVQVEDIPICSNSIQPDQLAGRTKEIVTSLPDATCLVDAGGMGIIFCKMLEGLDVPNLVKVKWGNPCFSKRHKERFINQRAQSTVGLRDAIKNGRFGVRALALRPDIISQGSRIPYGFDEKARYFIHPKRSKEWEGMPSPDIFDTLCFPFLSDVSYIASSMMPADQADKIKSAAEKADEAFADA
jgi:hypothetical protein